MSEFKEQLDIYNVDVESVLKFYLEFIELLRDNHRLMKQVFDYTNVNINATRLKITRNKVYKTFELEYTDYENEKRYSIEIKTGKFYLKKKDC